MSLEFTQIDDAVQLTQEALIAEDAFVNMQTDLTRFVALREIWTKKKKTFRGGHPLRFDIQMDHNHSARAVGLFETDGGSINDTMVKGESPIRFVNAHYEYDQREPEFQAGAHAIVDLVKTRYSAMQMSFFKYLEEVFWSKPADSSDVKTPYGIPYYVVKNSTEGFHGGNPAGFAAGCAGINSTTYPRWNNYTGSYVAITTDDLVNKMKRASLSIDFQSPLSHKEPTLSNMGNGIYVNMETIITLEKILAANNMSLGNDLASKDGKTMFKGTSITYVPQLNNDTTNPVYMLDWMWMYAVALAGWQNKLTKPYQVADKHTVRRVDRDVSLNMVCTDRRRQAVLSL